MKGRNWLIGVGAVVLATAVVWTVLGADSRDHAGRAQDSVATPGISVRSAVEQEASLVTIYKSPACACCGEWAEHMQANGFPIEVKEMANLAEVRKDPGVPLRLLSCHTATAGGYTLEGHVPSDVVRELLAERPEIAGLAVPGMPPGVPGMPDPGPDRRPYDVLALRRDGSTYVYATR